MFRSYKLQVYFAVLMLSTYMTTGCAAVVEESQEMQIAAFIEASESVAREEIGESGTAEGSEGTEVQDAAALIVQEEPAPQPLSEEAMVENVPFIQQMPELARGCEVTSLAMLLRYAGVRVDKMTLAQEIATVPFWDGNVHGDPNEGFVGDIYTFSKSGYGVYHKPIADLASKYLPGRVTDLTGSGIEELYKKIDAGTPVWVITNATFAPLPSSEFRTWETKSGAVTITYREHSVLIVGYDTQYVYINDPLANAAYTPVPRANFEEAWVQMGRQAVSYE